MSFVRFIFKHARDGGKKNIYIYLQIWFFAIRAVQNSDEYSFYGLPIQELDKSKILTHKRYPCPQSMGKRFHIFTGDNSPAG